MPAGFSGEFESEVALPVRVRYVVDSEGRIELTHVALAGPAAHVERAAALVWPHLPLRERHVLEHEAEMEARKVEDRRS